VDYRKVDVGSILFGWQEEEISRKMVNVSFELGEVTLILNVNGTLNRIELKEFEKVICHGDEEGENGKVNESKRDFCGIFVEGMDCASRRESGARNDDGEHVSRRRKGRRMRKGKGRKRKGRRKNRSLRSWRLRVVVVAPSVPSNVVNIRILFKRDGENKKTYHECRSTFELFTHVFSNRSQSNTREEVDREPRILGIIDREDVAQERL